MELSRLTATQPRNFARGSKFLEAILKTARSLGRNLDVEPLTGEDDSGLARMGALDVREEGHAENYSFKMRFSRIIWKIAT